MTAKSGESPGRRHHGLRAATRRPGGTRAGVRCHRHPRRLAPLVDDHRDRPPPPPAACCASGSPGWTSRSSCASTLFSCPPPSQVVLCGTHPGRRMDRQHDAIRACRPWAAELAHDFRDTGIGRELVAEGMGALPGQPGCLRRARQGQPARRLTGRPGQTRAGRRQTPRNMITHALQLTAEIPLDSRP